MTPNEAHKLATLAHFGQFRRDGITPYVTHAEAVANMMTTDEEKIVAYLHDVIEDTDYICTAHVSGSAAYICDKPFGEMLEKNRVTIEIWSALHAITKKQDKTYSEYLLGVSQNKLATKVKIGDICHNLSCNPSDHAKQKYLKALPVLLAAL